MTEMGAVKMQHSVWVTILDVFSCSAQRTSVGPAVYYLISEVAYLTCS